MTALFDKALEFQYILRVNLFVSYLCKYNVCFKMQLTLKLTGDMLLRIFMVNKATKTLIQLSKFLY